MIAIEEVRAMLAQIPAGPGYEDRVEAAVLTAIRSAVAAEREACAQVIRDVIARCEETQRYGGGLSEYGKGWLGCAIALLAGIRALRSAAMSDQPRDRAELRKPTHRHYKGGLYRALFEATHTETDEVFVVYEACASGTKWMRPKPMFYGSLDDGTVRFTPIAASPFARKEPPSD